MALKWIIGNFKTGAITENAELPVIKGSDKLSIDINAGDAATLKVSLDDLPSDWRTYLKPLEKMVALVDDSRTNTDGVLWAGFINKTSAVVNGAVAIQVAGLREYLASRSTSKIFNTTVTSPKSGTTYTADTVQGIMKKMVEDCFSSVGIPSGSPTPPAVLGTVSGSYTGTALKYTVLDKNFMFFNEALADVADTLSTGEEYVFRARWTSAAKTAIVWDCVIGTATQPHINENILINVELADNAWQPIAFNQSMAASRMASRLIAQSKYGDEKKDNGADFTSKTSTAGTTILIDQVFNPGVELTPAQMTSQLNSRITYASTTEKESAFTRVYTDFSNLVLNLTYLGRMATFTGTQAAKYFGLSMRIVSIDFNASDQKVEIGLMQKAARYPRLPKNSIINKNNPDRNDWNTPPIVTPQPPNVPIPPDPGDGGGGTPTPPFELPTFKEDSPFGDLRYGNLKGVPVTSTRGIQLMFDPLSIRQQGGNIFWSRHSFMGNIPRYNPVIQPDEYLWGNGSASTDQSFTIEPFKVYKTNLEDLNVQTKVEEEEAGVNEDIATGWRNNSSPDIPWDVIFRKGFSMYQPDVQITEGSFSSPDRNKTQNPLNARLNAYDFYRNIDINLSVGEGYIYATFMYSYTDSKYLPDDEFPIYKYKTKENTWRISHNNNVWGTWEDMGSIFSLTNETGKDFYLWAPNSTFIENGKITTIGGYILSKSDTAGDFAVRSLPHFASIYYQHVVLDMNLDGSGKTLTYLEIPFKDKGLDSQETADELLGKGFQYGYPRKLSVRNESGEFIVSSTSFVNRREVFSINKKTLKPTLIMDSNTSPGVVLRDAPFAFFKNINQGLGPIKIKNSILDVFFSGEKFKTGNSIKMENRAINCLRGKIGFTDAVFSQTKLPDLEVTWGNNPSRYPDKGLGIRSELLSAGHTFSTLSSITGGNVTNLRIAGNYWDYVTPPGSTSGGMFLSPHGDSFSTPLKAYGERAKSWSNFTYSSVTMDEGSFWYINNNGAAHKQYARNGLWWGYWNGYIYAIFDTKAKAFGPTGTVQDDAKIQVLKMAVDLTKL